MGGSFGIDDYFIESDGDEADDEYDQLANAKIANSNQYQLSVPPEVSHTKQDSSLFKFICDQPVNKFHHNFSGTRVTSL